jgi:hypothetical protein
LRCRFAVIWKKRAGRHAATESQAIRANNSNVIRAFKAGLTFRNGVVDQLKEMCRVYVSKSIDCEY